MCQTVTKQTVWLFACFFCFVCFVFLTFARGKLSPICIFCKFENTRTCLTSLELQRERYYPSTARRSRERHFSRFEVAPPSPRKTHPATFTHRKKKGSYRLSAPHIPDCLTKCFFVAMDTTSLAAFCGEFLSVRGNMRAHTFRTRLLVSGGSVTLCFTLHSREVEGVGEELGG